jgi:hypothetical protein
MDDWHCGTTHCRAGWVVTLAGQQGKDLESRIGTALAANKIYQNSSDIKVPWTIEFYKTSEEAALDIKRCADEERILNIKI